jgi:hypothetical protein
MKVLQIRTRLYLRRHVGEGAALHRAGTEGGGGEIHVKVIYL